MEAVKDTYCYSPESIGTPGIWGVNVFDYMLPVFIGQLLLVIFITRVVSFLLKPLRQPKVIAETIAGMLLGPSFLGNFFNEAYDLMPDQNYVLLDTAANFALTYYMFMVAVELDVRTIRGMGRKVLIIAVVGMVLAFVVSFTSAYALGLRPDIVIKMPGFPDPPANSRADEKVTPFLLFFSLAVSVTGLPVLTRIITELKLLNSPLGPLSMASAILNDMFAWILLAVTLAATGGKDGKSVSLLVPLWVTLAGAAFVLVCFYVVRPGIARMARRTPEGERMSDFHLGIILAGVPATGFLSDLIGIHSIFGSFIYGLAVPNGPLTAHLIERMEPFLENMLLPLFFANSGFRTNIFTILPLWAISSFAAVVVLSTLAKVVGTIIVAMFYSISFRDSLALGFLMSVKGPVEMIILNVAIDKKVLRGDMFAVILVTSLITTALAAPVVTLAYIKPSKPLAVYRRRNIQGARPDAELRMLACIHNTRHVHCLTRLLDVSNPSKRSPIVVYALHLVEVAGRVSSMLIMHPSAGYSDHGRRHRPALPYGQAQSESILAAIEGYEQHSPGVSFQPLTAFSQPATMHEDVCSVAEERHASLIVLPFHKQMTVDGAMEEVGSTAVRPVNLNVLANAPCSVAILVDRGLGTGVTSLFPGAHRASHHVVLVFIGGPDDREALAYAGRMAEHPAIVLTVIRFIEAAAPSRSQSISSVTDVENAAALLADAELEKERDEEAVNEFRLRFVSDESVVFTEKVASNGGETVAALREMRSSYDLYVVGRGHGRKSALTAGLEEWSEIPELGPIGDLLASSDFGAKVSVLVVQQYVEKELAEADWEALGHNGPSNANRQQRASGFNSGWN
ncbi:cation/H(+) antiporter 15-like [Phoenix dactylifera]|uniref:Cation/H(+) antiporter 15-like n=1 Tax=Phoenix dactylifera TaxID=42345 RepID=A0A8B9A924_PHODC|nr:cation/H(+) antiporter 15-like [Phoenix dactylifera]